MIKLWHKKINYILQFTLKNNSLNKSSENLIQILKCATESLSQTMTHELIFNKFTYNIK